MREPARLRHHEIEMIAMDDEVAVTIGTNMDIALGNLDAAEMSTIIAAQEFVMIARHVDHAGALARLAQQLLHHVVIGLRPVPGRTQPPAIDNVADQINGIGVMKAEEVEKKLRLASAGAEMNIGDEEGAKMPHAVFNHHLHTLQLPSPFGFYVSRIATK